MVRSSATLHMLPGKIAAGESTLASKLGEAENTIAICECSENCFRSKPSQSGFSRLFLAAARAS
jgi:hypothetical protein